MPKSPDFLSVPQVAELRGVTRAAVYYALRDGRLAGFRLGRRAWVIRAEDAEAWKPRSYALRSEPVARVRR